MPPPTLDVKLIAGMRELGYKEIKLVSNLLTTSNGGTFSGGHLPEEVLDFSGQLLEQNGTRGARAWKGGWRRVEEFFYVGKQAGSQFGHRFASRRHPQWQIQAQGSPRLRPSSANQPRKP